MCQRAHRHPCQSARNPFIVAQARGLPLVPSACKTLHPPPKMRLKKCPTARNGFFEDFAGAGFGAACPAVPAAELLVSPAATRFAATGWARLSAPPLELNVAATCVWIVPAGACGTVAGANPALTAAGKGCCSSVFATVPPDADGLNSASATDIVCSAGHPHAELS